MIVTRDCDFPDKMDLVKYKGFFSLTLQLIENCGLETLPYVEQQTDEGIFEALTEEHNLGFVKGFTPGTKNHDYQHDQRQDQYQNQY